MSQPVFSPSVLIEGDCLSPLRRLPQALGKSLAFTAQLGPSHPFVACTGKLCFPPRTSLFWSASTAAAVRELVPPAAAAARGGGHFPAAAAYYESPVVPLGPVQHSDHLITSAPWFPLGNFSNRVKVGGVDHAYLRWPASASEPRGWHFLGAAAGPGRAFLASRIWKAPVSLLRHWSPFRPSPPVKWPAICGGFCAVQPW